MYSNVYVYLNGEKRNDIKVVGLTISQIQNARLNNGELYEVRANGRYYSVEKCIPVCDGIELHLAE